MCGRFAFLWAVCIVLGGVLCVLCVCEYSVGSLRAGGLPRARVCAKESLSRKKSWFAGWPREEDGGRTSVLATLAHRSHCGVA